MLLLLLCHCPHSALHQNHQRKQARVTITACIWINTLAVIGLSGCRSVTSVTFDVISPTYTLMFTVTKSYNSRTTTHTFNGYNIGNFLIGFTCNMTSRFFFSKSVRWSDDKTQYWNFQHRQTPSQNRCRSFVVFPLQRGVITCHGPFRWMTLWGNLKKKRYSFA